MEQLREMIARVARSQAPVHIYGESGTGKELVARLIHESGARREGPFVAVNCGAIPTELMESELFGHKRGSFTGAVADKKGLVQSAEGGTLFLDEVADLPLHMQVKLLRVVQEKTVRPVGEAREETVDVRILSATHKNLGRAGRPGTVPRGPLLPHQRHRAARAGAARAQRGHSATSPSAILQRLARRTEQRAAADLAQDAIELLEAYPFPGNVRELENVLERALTLCTGGRDHRRAHPPARARAPAAEAGDCSRSHGLAEGSGALGDAARGHRARRHRQGAGEDPLQQDRGREAAGDELPGAALPDQEARHRVASRAADGSASLCDVDAAAGCVRSG